MKASLYIPTSVKIKIATILHTILSLFLRKHIRVITRDGLRYEADLSEGIDLAFYLFGRFQKHTYKSTLFQFRGDEVVFDVGANTGLTALQYARAVPRGLVYAFEPTHYAFQKLKKNLTLNPELAERIVPIQSFVSSHGAKNPKMTAYASWKVDGSSDSYVHPIHKGTAKNTEGIAALTLDNFATERKISHVDLIKIDTDGYEWEVLQGACKIIKNSRPKIIFELGAYLINERGHTFAQYEEFFHAHGYTLKNGKSGVNVTSSDQLPEHGTIDVAALPS